MNINNSIYIKKCGEIIPLFYLGLKILSLKEIRFKLYDRGLTEDVFQCLILACLISNSYRELSRNISKELYKLDKETFFIYKPIQNKKKLNKYGYRNLKHNCDCCDNNYFTYKNKYGYKFLCKICYNRLRKQQNSPKNRKRDCECCKDWRKETRYFNPKIAKKYHYICNDCYLEFVKKLNKNDFCKICGWQGTRYHNLCKQCYAKLRRKNAKTT